jgi:hypothetical protein
MSYLLEQYVYWNTKGTGTGGVLRRIPEYRRMFVLLVRMYYQQHKQKCIVVPGTVVLRIVLIPDVLVLK